MTNPTSSNPVGVLKITLAASGRSRTFTGAELARLLDSPGIVVRLAAVLYSRPGRLAAGKRTTGKEENVAQEQRSFRWNDGAKDQSISAREQAVERTASYLADKLGDPKVGNVVMLGALLEATGLAAPMWPALSTIICPRLTEFVLR